jgi:hypothetical protein
MKISHAYYSATISSFLADDPDRIAGVLSTEASRVFRRLLFVRRSYDERYKEEVFA